MKKLKTISTLAATLLSTTVFAGGLGLGLGANINAGAGVGLGGIGLQSGVSQQTDAQVNAGSQRADARQSSSVQGDIGIDQSTVTRVLPSARIDAAAAVQSRSNQRNANVETDLDRRGASGNVESSVGADVGHTAKRIAHGVNEAALTARQSAQSQRARAHERLVHSGASVSGNVQGSEQLRVEKPAGRLPRGNVRQSSELNIGG